MVDRTATLIAGHYEYDAGARVLYVVKDNQVLRWNVTTGAYMTPFTFAGPLSDVAVSSDSRYVVVGASETTTVSGVDVGTLYRFDILTGVTTTIHYDLAFYELGVAQVEITATNEEIGRAHV